MAIFTQTIKLKDEASGAAKKAAQEVSGLADKVKAAEKALGNAQGDMGKYMKALGEVGKAQKALKEGQEKHTKALQGQYDANSSLMSQLEGLSVGWEAVSGYVLGAVAAIGAAVVAFGALTVAGAAYAIKASEAKMASIALWDALGQGKVTGQEVDDLLDNMREKTGLTKDSLGKMTEMFLRMGITGTAELENLTIAASSAEATIKGGGQAFAKLIQMAKVSEETGNKLKMPFKKLESQLVKAGLTTGQLAAEMGMTETAMSKAFKEGTVDATKFSNALESAITKKGAGPLQRMALSVTNLGGLLEEYIGDIFEDLGPAIAPFLAQVMDLFQIFNSKTKPSGMALKDGIEGFFKRVFALATKVVPMIKHFLLDVIIFGLKAYIALKPIVKWFQEMADNATVIKVATFFFDGLKIALVVAAGAILLVVGLFGALVATGLLITATIWGVVTAIGTGLVDALSTVLDWLAGAENAASNFIQGLVDGIVNGAGLVVDAVKGLAGKAVSGFKDALGIHSPSAVMMQLGAHTGEGFAQGIESKSPDIHGAAQGMASSAAVGASGSPAQSVSNSDNSKSISVVVEPGAIVINGGSGGSTIELTEDAISLVFERIAMGAGL